MNSFKFLHWRCQESMDGDGQGQERDGHLDDKLSPGRDSVMISRFTENCNLQCFLPKVRLTCIRNILESGNGHATEPCRDMSETSSAMPRCTRVSSSEECSDLGDSCQQMGNVRNVGDQNIDKIAEPFCDDIATRHGEMKEQGNEGFHATGKIHVQKSGKRKCASHIEHLTSIAYKWSKLRQSTISKPSLSQHKTTDVLQPKRKRGRPRKPQQGSEHFNGKRPVQGISYSDIDCTATGTCRKHPRSTYSNVRHTGVPQVQHDGNSGKCTVNGDVQSRVSVHKQEGFLLPKKSADSAKVIVLHRRKRGRPPKLKRNKLQDGHKCHRRDTVSLQEHLMGHKHTDLHLQLGQESKFSSDNMVFSELATHHPENELSLQETCSREECGVKAKSLHDNQQMRKICAGTDEVEDVSVAREWKGTQDINNANENDESQLMCLTPPSSNEQCLPVSDDKCQYSQLSDTHPSDSSPCISDNIDSTTSITDQGAVETDADRVPIVNVESISSVELLCESASASNESASSIGYQSSDISHNDRTPSLNVECNDLETFSAIKDAQEEEIEGSKGLSSLRIARTFTLCGAASSDTVSFSNRSISTEVSKSPYCNAIWNSCLANPTDDTSVEHVKERGNIFEALNKSFNRTKCSNKGGMLSQEVPLPSTTVNSSKECRCKTGDIATGEQDVDLDIPQLEAYGGSGCLRGQCSPDSDSLPVLEKENILCSDRNENNVEFKSLSKALCEVASLQKDSTHHTDDGLGMTNGEICHDISDDGDAAQLIASDDSQKPLFPSACGETLTCGEGDEDEFEFETPDDRKSCKDNDQPECESPKISSSNHVVNSLVLQSHISSTHKVTQSESEEMHASVLHHTPLQPPVRTDSMQQSYAESHQDGGDDPLPVASTPPSASAISCICEPVFQDFVSSAKTEGQLVGDASDMERTAEFRILHSAEDTIAADPGDACVFHSRTNPSGKPCMECTLQTESPSHNRNEQHHKVHQGECISCVSKTVHEELTIDTDKDMHKEGISYATEEHIAQLVSVPADNNDPHDTDTREEEQCKNDIEDHEAVIGISQDMHHMLGDTLCKAEEKPLHSLGLPTTSDCRFVTSTVNLRETASTEAEIEKETIRTHEGSNKITRSADTQQHECVFIDNNVGVLADNTDSISKTELPFASMAVNGQQDQPHNNLMETNIDFEIQNVTTLDIGEETLVSGRDVEGSLEGSTLSDLPNQHLLEESVIETNKDLGCNDRNEEKFHRTCIFNETLSKCSDKADLQKSSWTGQSESEGKYAHNAGVCESQRKGSVGNIVKTEPVETSGMLERGQDATSVAEMLESLCNYSSDVAAAVDVTEDHVEPSGMLGKGQDAMIMAKLLEPLCNDSSDVAAVVNVTKDPDDDVYSTASSENATVPYPCSDIEEFDYENEQSQGLDFSSVTQLSSSSISGQEMSDSPVTSEGVDSLSSTYPTDWTMKTHKTRRNMKHHLYTKQQNSEMPRNENERDAPSGTACKLPEKIDEDIPGISAQTAPETLLPEIDAKAPKPFEDTHREQSREVLSQSKPSNTKECKEEEVEAEMCSQNKLSSDGANSSSHQTYLAKPEEYFSESESIITKIIPETHKLSMIKSEEKSSENTLKPITSCVGESQVTIEKNSEIKRDQQNVASTKEISGNPSPTLHLEVIPKREESLCGRNSSELQSKNSIDVMTIMCESRKDEHSESRGPEVQEIVLTSSVSVKEEAIAEELSKLSCPLRNADTMCSADDVTAHNLSSGCTVVISDSEDSGKAIYPSARQVHSYCTENKVPVSAQCSVGASLLSKCMEIPAVNMSPQSNGQHKVQSRFDKERIQTKMKATTFFGEPRKPTVRQKESPLARNLSVPYHMLPVSQQNSHYPMSHPPAQVINQWKLNNFAPSQECQELRQLLTANGSISTSHNHLVMNEQLVTMGRDPVSQQMSGEREHAVIGNHVSERLIAQNQLAALRRQSLERKQASARSRLQGCGTAESGLNDKQFLPYPHLSEYAGKHVSKQTDSLLHLHRHRTDANINSDLERGNLNTNPSSDVSTHHPGMKVPSAYLRTYPIRPADSIPSHMPVFHPTHDIHHSMQHVADGLSVTSVNLNALHNRDPVITGITSLNTGRKRQWTQHYPIQHESFSRSEGHRQQAMNVQGGFSLNENRAGLAEKLSSGKSELEQDIMLQELRRLHSEQNEKERQAMFEKLSQVHAFDMVRAKDAVQRDPLIHGAQFFLKNAAIVDSSNHIVQRPSQQSSAVGSIQTDPFFSHDCSKDSRTPCSSPCYREVPLEWSHKTVSPIVTPQSSRTPTAWTDVTPPVTPVRSESLASASSPVSPSSLNGMVNINNSKIEDDKPLDLTLKSNTRRFHEIPQDMSLPLDLSMTMTVKNNAPPGHDGGRSEQNYLPQVASDRREKNYDLDIRQATASELFVSEPEQSSNFFHTSSNACHNAVDIVTGKRESAKVDASLSVPMTQSCGDLSRRHVGNSTISENRGSTKYLHSIQIGHQLALPCSKPHVQLDTVKEPLPYVDLSRKGFTCEGPGLAITRSLNSGVSLTQSKTLQSILYSKVNSEHARGNLHNDPKDAIELTESMQASATDDQYSNDNRHHSEGSRNRHTSQSNIPQSMQSVSAAANDIASSESSRNNPSDVLHPSHQHTQADTGLSSMTARKAIAQGTGEFLTGWGDPAKTVQTSSGAVMHCPKKRYKLALAASLSGTPQSGIAEKQLDGNDSSVLPTQVEVALHSNASPKSTSQPANQASENENIAAPVIRRCRGRPRGSSRQRNKFEKEFDLAQKSEAVIQQCQFCEFTASSRQELRCHQNQDHFAKYVIKPRNSKKGCMIVDV